jgi:hypothetical protein
MELGGAVKLIVHTFILPNPIFIAADGITVGL